MICPVCDTEFTPRRSRQINCSTGCAKIAHNSSRTARGRSEQSKASSRARDKRRDEQETVDRIRNQPFPFIDGEGINDHREVSEYIEELCYHEFTDGTSLYFPTTREVIEIAETHSYSYMSAATVEGNAGRLTRDYPEENHLRTTDILRWLWRLPKGNVWGYSLGYDWTMILIDMLYTEEGIEALWQIYHPEVNRDGTPRNAFDIVWWRNWGIVKTQAAVELWRRWKHGPDHARCRKNCTLNPGDWIARPRFFQDGFKCWGGGSFVSQIENWDIGTPEERAAVTEMKKKRSHFYELTEQVKRYCDLEVKLGSQLARAQVTTACDLDIRPPRGRWYSTGSGAKALLNKYGVVAKYKTVNSERVMVHEGYRGPDRYAGAPKHMIEDIMRSFFGGRFEIRLTGFFAQLFLKDFASAYPAVIRDLPCLSHGKWTDYYVEGALNFGHVQWEPSHFGDSDFGPFPWRWPNQRIYYPEAGEGIYCEPEIRAAQKLHGFDIEEVRWFSFMPECDHKPLAFVSDLYTARLELGKDGKGLVLKITLNSIYGTFADTISPDSKYASVVWAAWITSTVRSWLLKILAEYPDITVGFATDGAIMTQDITTWGGGKQVFPEDAKKLALGSLGSEGTLTNALMIQPGVYTADEGPAKKRHRTRGHNMDELLKLRADLASEWDWHGWDATVQYTRSRFIGAKQALARKNTLAVYGQWVEQPVDVSFKASNREMLDSKEPAKPSIATMHHLHNEKIPAMSSAYDKLIALETYRELRELDEDNESQPGF
jgi:hypothetical protein